MTEKQLRKRFVNTAKSYWGCKELDGSHKKIIDLYNTQKKLPRNYRVKYTDEWCATFVSAIGVQLGWTDIILPECSCNEMIELYKAAGRWQERDDYVPNPGDLVMYDWQDNGKGDNTGRVDHVGIVVAVTGDDITVIEGNKKEVVDYRQLKVNGKNIRGYCLPDFASKAEPTVLEWQKAAIADGFEFPKYGADGKWGAECVSVAIKAVVKRRPIHRYKNLTKLVQRAVGVTADGLCGRKTEKAIKAYQERVGLTPDGKCGPNTWKKILGVS